MKDNIKRRKNKICIQKNIINVLYHLHSYFKVINNLYEVDYALYDIQELLHQLLITNNKLRNEISLQKSFKLLAVALVQKQRE